MAGRGIVSVLITGDVKPLRRELKEGEAALGRFGGTVGKVSNSLDRLSSAQNVSKALKGVTTELGGTKTALVGVGVGAVAAGAGLAAMAVKGISEFTNLAAEVRQFQRVSGATAEESSRLIDVTEQYGISADQAAAAVFKLSQNIEKKSAVLKADGIEIAKNKDGTTDLTGTLLNVVDAYKRTADQGKRNKLVMDAFGKSGAALIPILDQGRDSIEAMFKETDKHHELLSQDDLDKAEEYRVAVHDLSEAFSGLEMELGQGLLPVLTSTAKGLTSVVDVADRFVIGPISKIDHVVNGAGRALHNLAFGSDKAKESGRDLTEQFRNGTAVAAEHELQMKADAAALEEVGAAADGAAASAESFSDVLGSALALRDAESDLSDATQTLSDDLSGVGDSASSSAGKVRTFQDAMRDEFDSLVDANEAALDYQDSIDSLNEALHGVAAGSENASDAMERLTKGGKIANDPRAIKRATDAAVKAAEREVDAMVESGQVADTAEARKEALRQKLVELQKQFPEVATSIDQYIGRLDKIPNLTTHAETATVRLSKKKKDLAKDIRDVVGAADAEATALEGSGSVLDKGIRHHEVLLQILTDLKQRFPELAAVINDYVNDVNTAYEDFLRKQGLGAGPSGTLHVVPTPTSGTTTTAPTPSTSPIHVQQNIYGDGLNSKEVADLSATRFKRALVGSRVA